jgi:hypothetical protein
MRPTQNIQEDACFFTMRRLSLHHGLHLLAKHLFLHKWHDVTPYMERRSLRSAALGPKGMDAGATQIQACEVRIQDLNQYDSHNNTSIHDVTNRDTSAVEILIENINRVPIEASLELRPIKERAMSQTDHDPAAVGQCAEYNHMFPSYRDGCMHGSTREEVARLGQDSATSAATLSEHAQQRGCADSEYMLTFGKHSEFYVNRVYALPGGSGASVQLVR